MEDTMTGYGPAYQQMQWAPPMGMGPQIGGPTFPQIPQMGQMGGMPGQGGGWAGALGNFTGWNDMGGMQKAYMLASIGGGVADYFERKSQRDEEKRRYEQALAESERHRRQMGANLNAVWGG